VKKGPRPFKKRKNGHQKVSQKGFAFHSKLREEYGKSFIKPLNGRIENHLQ